MHRDSISIRPFTSWDRFNYSSDFELNIDNDDRGIIEKEICIELHKRVHMHLIRQIMQYSSKKTCESTVFHNHRRRRRLLLHYIQPNLLPFTWKPLNHHTRFDLVDSTKDTKTSSKHCHYKPNEIFIMEIKLTKDNRTGNLVGHNRGGFTMGRHQQLSCLAGSLDRIFR